MNKSYTSFLLSLLLIFQLAQLRAQIGFSNANTLFQNAAIHSGVAMAVADWNNDGLDDVIRLDLGRIAIVEVQTYGGEFETINFGQMATASAWAMCVADVDKNGYLDIIGGWNGSCKIFKINNSGTAATLITLPNSNFFLQNITAADFNNDGHIDIFTCDDNGENSIYLNDGLGNFSESNIINFNVTATDDSGNYGSVWTDFDNDGDFDLYIAKCRQGVSSPNDGRRINVLFVNNGNGTFTENAAAYNINIGAQTWTASFGDIDNDSDMDLMLTNHDVSSMILENNGSGVYTNITAGTGFNINDIIPIQSVFADFDNDGFLDIFVTGTNSRLFRNNGNKTFTLQNGLFNANSMESFAVGDLNHDGFLDIYGGYANLYTSPTSIDDVLWMNNTNANHFIGFRLSGIVSNKDAIGAKVKIYGPWGVQVREVRAGESYGTCNALKLHFGIGSALAVDSARITFPSGATQKLINLAADRYIHIIENTCVSVNPLISFIGPEVICPGSTVTLNAPAGLQYLWSNGATTQQNSISATGDYYLRLTDENGCREYSSYLNVTSGQALNTTITATMCPGAAYTLPDGTTTNSTGTYTAVVPSSNGCDSTITVILTEQPQPVIVSNTIAASCGINNGSITTSINGATAPFSYNWNNGATTPSLTNLGNGTYSLTVTDANGCSGSALNTITSGICPQLNGHSMSAISQNTATVNWPAYSCAQKYRIILKKSGSGEQFNFIVPAPSTSTVLSGLEPNTTYQVRMRVQCSSNGSVVSNLSPIVTFTTLNSQGIICTPPSNVTVNTTPIAATFNWTPAFGAQTYNLRYRISGSSAWSVITGINASLASFTLNNLNPSTSYQFQLRSKCSSNPDEFSPYTAQASFNTLAARNSEVAETMQVSISPNPASDYFNLDIDIIGDKELFIKVCDILGREMLSESIVPSSNHIIRQYAVADWQDGVYLVYVNQGKRQFISKILKQ